MDDRLSIGELSDYCKSKFLPFTDEQITDMFRDASSGRGIVHDTQRNLPLTLEEV